MIHLSTGWGIYLIGFAVMLCISWLAFTIDIPDRSTKCAECDAERRQAVFMRDAVRAMGGGMVTSVVVLNSIMWPVALLSALAQSGSHRRHAGT